MPINSHVQLPVSIIKNFSHKGLVVSREGRVNKTDFVYELKFSEKQIKDTQIKEYGAKEGYYEKEIEDLLSSKYETPLGELKGPFLEFAKKKRATLEITREDFATLKNYFRALLFRNESFFQLYKNESYFARMGIADKPSDFVQACHETSVDMLPGFKSLSLTIAIAEGHRSFINNYCGFAFVRKQSQLGGEGLYFVPLAPKIGIVFFRPKSTRKEDLYKDLLLFDDDSVLKINKWLVETEIELTNDSLIALKKEDLEGLIEFVETRQAKRR